MMCVVVPNKVQRLFDNLDLPLVVAYLLLVKLKLGLLVMDHHGRLVALVTIVFHGSGERSSSGRF